MVTESPDQSAVVPAAGRTPPGRRFTPHNAIRLSPAEAERQGRVTRIAIEKLGAQAAILFLNSQHDDLSDRPLPLATASEDGLRSVLRLLEPTAG